MPEGTLDEVRANGKITGDTITPNIKSAHLTMKELAAAGIDFNDVTSQLESEGVEKFSSAWNELLEKIATQLSEAKANA